MTTPIIPWWEWPDLDETKYRPKYTESPFVTICDLVNPETGKTYREENAEKVHNIPIGALVEILPDEDGYENDMAGVRLFVVSHERDCDQTPIYSLCADPNDTIVKKDGFGNTKWYNGFTEEGLAIVRDKLK